MEVGFTRALLGMCVLSLGTVTARQPSWEIPGRPLHSQLEKNSASQSTSETRTDRGSSSVTVVTCTGCRPARTGHARARGRARASPRQDGCFRHSAAAGCLLPCTGCVCFGCREVRQGRPSSERNTQPFQHEQGPLCVVQAGAVAAWACGQSDGNSTSSEDKGQSRERSWPS